MKSFAFLTLVLATVIAVFGEISDYDEAVKRGNRFVDKVIEETINEHSSEIDPYMIDDTVVGFHRKVVFVNVSGEAKLHDGFIRGLSTLSRKDGCLLEEKKDRLRVQANLGAGVLDMEYSGTAKFMNFGPTITVHGTVDYVEVTLVMTCNADDGWDGRIEKFHIDEIKGMKVWITGLGPINWAVNAMISGVTTVFRGFIHRLIEVKIQAYLNYKIMEYQFPVEGVDVDYTTKDDLITETTGEPLEQTTQSPVEETTPPVEETEPPVEETDPPVEETEPPVEETEPPVEETEPPVGETEPPIEETEPPVEETEPPVEETEPPVEEPDTEE